MPKARRAFVEKGVADNAAAKVQEAVGKLKPDLVSLDEFKAKARKAATPEGRLASAKPFPLPTLDMEVMVAPLFKQELYDRLFDPRDGIFASEEPERNIDRDFIKQVILNCIVSPILDGEALDLLIEASPAEFQLLSKFCMDLTMGSTVKKIGERLATLDTDAEQLFFAGLRASMNIPMPA